MTKLTAGNLASFINQLPKNRFYNYLNSKNKSLIKIVEVILPEGPIKFKRFNPEKHETEQTAKVVSISSTALWRLANAFNENVPVSIDRIFGASFNFRAVLETLLAHTPQFYFCYPGRIQSISTQSTVKKGHKHLLWRPSDPHKPGITVFHESDTVISEIPSSEVIYDALVLPSINKNSDLDIEVQRRHAQIQIALLSIGNQLNFRTWIAQNDKSIVYENKKLGEFDGVISDLSSEKIIAAYDEVIKAALLIDVIWFQNSTLMPAVMEIEHSTKVVSGLVRMKSMYDQMPRFPTRFVIVASDEDREKVFKEGNKEQFKPLNLKYFPYSAVEELYSLCQRRKINGVTEEFLDSFMESVNK